MKRSLRSSFIVLFSGGISTVVVLAGASAIEERRGVTGCELRRQAYEKAVEKMERALDESGADSAAISHWSALRAQALELYRECVAETEGGLARGEGLATPAATPPRPVFTPPGRRGTPPPFTPPRGTPRFTPPGPPLTPPGPPFAPPPTRGRPLLTPPRPSLTPPGPPLTPPGRG